MEVVLYETDVEIYSVKKSSTLSYVRFHQNEEIIFYDRRMSRKNLKAAAFLQSAKVCEAASLCALPSDRASEAPSLCALPFDRASAAPSLYASLTGQTSEAPSPCALPSDRASEAPSLCALPSDRACEAPSLCALPSDRACEAPSLRAIWCVVVGKCNFYVLWLAELIVFHMRYLIVIICHILL
jgi:hypothetical protein